MFCEEITKRAVVGTKSLTVFGVVFTVTEDLGFKLKDMCLLTGMAISVVALSIIMETDGILNSTVETTDTFLLKITVPS